MYGQETSWVYVITESRAEPNEVDLVAAFAGVRYQEI